MQNLSDVFAHALKGMYFCQSAVASQLPSLAIAASNKQLNKLMVAHAEETSELVADLRTIFDSIGKPPRGEPCDVTIALLAECEIVIGLAESAEARNATIVGWCQAIERFEIARIDSLSGWAEALGNRSAYDLLVRMRGKHLASAERLESIAQALNSRASKPLN